MIVRKATSAIAIHQMIPQRTQARQPDVEAAISRTANPNQTAVPVLFVLSFLFSFLLLILLPPIVCGIVLGYLEQSPAIPQQ